MSNKAPQYTITTAKVAAVRTALKNEAQAERKISKADALMQAAGVQQTSNAQKLATMFQKDVAKFGATVVAKAIREELNLVSDKVDGVQLNAAYGRFNVLWTRAQSLMEGVEVKAAAKVSPRKVAQERFASLRKDEQQLVKQLMKFDAESIAFLSRIAAAL